MKIPTLATLAALVAVAATPAAAANLIINGGFESPVPPAQSFTIFGGGSNGLTGWQVLGPHSNAVALLDTNYTELAGLSHFNAFAGEAALDLSGGGNAGPTAGVSQTVSTDIGQEYRLSFWLGNEDGAHNSNYALPSSLMLSISGVPAFQSPFTNAATTLNSVNWQRFTTTFVATATTTNIQFLNATPLADAFTGLDNVSLTAVPEPATWAMMIAGFGLMGATLRRRARLTLAA